MSFDTNPTEARRGFVFKSIFIDGSFLFHCGQQLNIRIDYRKLRALLLEPNDHLTGCTYYTALPPDSEIQDGHRAFLNLLKRDLKIRVRSVPLMKISQGVDHGSDRYAKGEDILMACDIIRGAMLNSFDTCVLVTGDGDFVPLVQQIQEIHGKLVQVVSFRSSLSQALELEASSVVYLDDHLDIIRWMPNPRDEERTQFASRQGGNPYSFLGKVILNKDDDSKT